MSSETPETAIAASDSQVDGDSQPQHSSSTPTNEVAKQDTLPTAVEFEPPLACVRRILKHSLPSSTNVGKDASAAFARATGIFIIYLTSCANDFARENKRQTITANDVLAATKELEFDEFLPDMTKFLENYRAMEKSKKDAKAKAAADRAGKSKENDEEEEDDNDSHDENEENERNLKRGYDDLPAANTNDSFEAEAKKPKLDEEPAGTEEDTSEKAADIPAQAAEVDTTA